MIRISIVTITFNAGRLLQRTLDSVARQSYDHIEHLIIDGASTDDTLQLAERYKAGSRHEVRLTSEPDRGIYDAMNKGLQQATGDFIVFLNAGDALHSAYTIETVVSTILQPSPGEQQKVGCVYGDTAITDEAGRYLHLRRLRPPHRLTWRSFRQGMLVCHQAFYVRSDLARQTPYDLRYRYSADVDWCIRIMKEAAQRNLQLANARTVLADFAEGGSTTRHHRVSLVERFQVMRRHYGLAATLLMHGWFVLRGVAALFRRR